MSFLRPNWKSTADDYQRTQTCGRSQQSQRANFITPGLNVVTVLSTPTVVLGAPSRTIPLDDHGYFSLAQYNAPRRKVTVRKL